jgi:hypothetical protein
MASHIDMKFNREMLESLFTGLLKSHPDQDVAKGNKMYAEAMVTFLLNLINDSIAKEDVTAPKTIGYGYLHSIKEHNEKYFIKTSLITGKTRTDGEPNAKFRFQHVDVLVSKRLYKFAQNLHTLGSNPFEGQMCKFYFENLHFEPKILNNKPINNTWGYITGLEMV